MNFSHTQSPRFDLIPQSDASHFVSFCKRWEGMVRRGKRKLKMENGAATPQRLCSAFIRHYNADNAGEKYVPIRSHSLEMRKFIFLNFHSFSFPRFVSFGFPSHFSHRGKPHQNSSIVEEKQKSIIHPAKPSSVYKANANGL